MTPLESGSEVGSEVLMSPGNALLGEGEEVGTGWRLDFEAESEVGRVGS
jgi:hypothetical protein